MATKPKNTKQGEKVQSPKTAQVPAEHNPDDLIAIINELRSDIKTLAECTLSVRNRLVQLISKDNPIDFDGVLKKLDNISKR